METEKPREFLTLAEYARLVTLQIQKEMLEDLQDYMVKRFDEIARQIDGRFEDGKA